MDCKITMDRSTSQRWSCDPQTGEMVDIIERSGLSFFDGYYCVTHEEDFETWTEAQAHMEAARVAA